VVGARIAFICVMRARAHLRFTDHLSPHGSFVTDVISVISTMAIKIAITITHHHHSRRVPGRPTICHT